MNSSHDFIDRSACPRRPRRWRPGRVAPAAFIEAGTNPIVHMLVFLLGSGLSLSLAVATDAFVPAGVFAPPRQGAVARLRDQIGRREPGLKTGIVCRGMKSSADQVLGSWVQSDGEMAAFKAVFAGEWVGYEANFRPDGSVVHVPEYLMPPELVEWDVKLKGFEHLTCSDVQGERVCLERRRLLPSCGCAVDAVPTELSFVENAVGAPGTVLFSDGAASLDHDSDNWTLILPLPAEQSLNGNAPVRVQLQGRGACPQILTLRVEERLHVTLHTPDKQAAMREMGKTSHWEIFRDPAQLQKMRPFPEQNFPVPFPQHVGSRWQKRNVVVEGRLQGEPSLALTPPRLPRIPARSWHTTSEYEAQDVRDPDRDHEEPVVNTDTGAQVLTCLPLGLSVRWQKVSRAVETLELSWHNTWEVEEKEGRGRGGERDGLEMEGGKGQRMRRWIRKEYEHRELVRVSCGLERLI